jgi:hypothetical protein
MKEQKNQVLEAARGVDRLVEDGEPRVDTTAIPKTEDFDMAAAIDGIPGTADFTAVPTAKRVVGLKNAAEGVNPKDRVGAAKVDLTLIPPTASIHCALALMDGATKYGPYNWRIEPIQARTYVAAIMRHCQAYLDGELSARDSGILHMGHAMACAAILIDAEMQGTLTDDRPIVPKKEATASMQLEAAHSWIVKHKQPGWGR